MGLTAAELCAKIAACNCAPSDSDFKKAVVTLLCDLVTAGGETNQVVSTCRVITVAGAYGDIGDIITIYTVLDTSTDPATVVSTFQYNETQNRVVEGVDDTNSEPCPVQDGCCNATAAEGILVSSSESAAGSVAAGFQGVSIMNIGAADGVVDGQPFIPGEVFEFNSYLDPQTQEFILSPEITYDGTGTTLRIRTLTH